jgi:hypothetical protein
MDGDGEAMLRHACAMGVEGDRIEAAEFTVTAARKDVQMAERKLDTQSVSDMLEINQNLSRNFNQNYPLPCAVYSPVGSPLMCGSSCKTTFSKELWTSRWPL